MDANAILDIIRSQAFIGNSGLAEDTVKLVRYLNMGYRKVYDLIVRDYPFFAAATQTVAITAGSGTFLTSPFYVLSVRNAGSSFQKLEVTTVEKLEESDPSLSAIGAPSHWYQEGFSTIKTYPSNTTSLRVRYIPNAATLTADSPESAIMVPPMFHDILAWETLKIVAYDERDKMAAGELKMIEEMYDDVEGRMKSYLNKRASQQPTRTKSVIA